MKEPIKSLLLFLTVFVLLSLFEWQVVRRFVYEPRVIENHHILFGSVSE